MKIKHLPILKFLKINLRQLKLIRGAITLAMDLCPYGKCDTCKDYAHILSEINETLNFIYDSKKDIRTNGVESKQRQGTAEELQAIHVAVSHHSRPDTGSERTTSEA